MRLNSRIWLVISLLLFAGAAYFWHKGDMEIEARRARSNQGQGSNAAPSAAATAASAPAMPVSAATNKVAPAAGMYRVSNTTRTLAQLERDNHAMLLRNASIDTAVAAEPKIPEKLKASENPGSYLVQSRRPLDAGFYSLVSRAGAQFVSYIPNNAALVSASKESAAQLKSSPLIQSVLPYHPYYKLDHKLLPVALGEKMMGTNNLLGVTAFPQGREALMARLEKMGAEILGEERTPFGTQLMVRTDDLVSLAQAPEVQEIEPSVPRALLNDITRWRVGVAIDTVATTNYLGLTGSNVVVAVNDSGVDAAHPDLTGRVFALPGSPAWLLTDSNQIFGAGHGTHVAGIIAGDGTKSATVTNASGSIMPGVAGQFRGKATAAKLFVQAVDLLSGPMISDAYLQETASRSNAFICNNSWGYSGLTSYSMSSASYDAATRDAQPGTNGSQPLLFVFSAGNEGGGNDEGVDGYSDTIVSPANAKNVITVGALESPRNITNEVVIKGRTNAEWLGMTDSDSQVASFSSRGNVGMGLEGDFGRFKPDVVAPGVFIASTRSSTFIDPNVEAILVPFYFTSELALPGTTNAVEVFVPDGGVLMNVQIQANVLSPIPFPTNLVILADTNRQPATVRPPGDFAVTPGDWFVGVSNPGTQPVSYDMAVYILVTNAFGNKFEVLSNLNVGLGPYYRYESGTSMAAPAVSGVLALMQEFLEKLNVHPSPALMKALLINGARRAADFYDYQVNRTTANDEGWGVVTIANSIPANLTTNSGSLHFFDQSPQTALATGESIRWDLTLAETNAPLRVTLVWTDPPGNPVAGIKLVNDLDLIVSNRVTGEIVVGNNFPAQTAYTEVGTNPVPSDIVNNVENAYIKASDGPLGTDYTVIVKAKRVNVNAVTAHTNGIVQDFALVISSGSSTSSVPFLITQPTRQADTQPWVMSLTNGIPVLYQRVGANSPILNGPAGTDIQWRFFIFTNEVKLTNTPYVALVTFLPPNLSTARNTDADIDLYVSTNASLLNLDAMAIAGADKSLQRGGTETIVYSNSEPGTVYYCGVKSEDQKAAEFGFLAIASSEPFSTKDANGNIVAKGVPMPVAVPDGSPQSPQKVPMFALGLDVENPQSRIRRLVVQEKINHPFLGDLFGILNRGAAQGAKQSVVVNNHSDHSTNLVTYDDSGELADAIHTDGPGNLRQYVGEAVTGGAWVFWLWDNAAAHNGIVEDFRVLIAPRPLDNNDFYVTIRSHGWYYDYIDVPTDGTNLNISVAFMDGNGPVDIVLRKGEWPPPADASTNGIMAPGGSLNLSITNTPVPLSGGRWYYGIYNGSEADVTLHVVIKIDRRMVPDLIKTFLSSNTPSPLLDDALTNSVIFVPVNEQVLAVQVGVRLDHPRASDLALSLTSPQGTRVLLFEDRGGTNATALGLGTNKYVYAMFTEDTNLFPQVIKFAQPPYGSTNGVVVSNITYFTSGFETNKGWDTNSKVTLVTNTVGTNTFVFTNVPGTYTNGQWIDGWLVMSNLVVTNRVITNGITNLVVTNLAITNNIVGVITDTNLANEGSNFLALASGRLLRIETNTVAGKPYRLSYAYRSPGIINWWPGDGIDGQPSKANDLIGTNNGTATNVIAKAGKVQEGFQFNGGDSTVSLGTNVGNFGTNDYTIDFWIRTSSQRYQEAVISKRETCNNGSWWDIRIGGNGVGVGHLSAEVCGDAAGTGLSTVITPQPVNDGLFHHAAIVRRGLLRSFYIDGVLVVTNTFAMANLTNNTDLLIGQNVCSINGDNTLPFSGELDELDFFNRALSPVEISAIYRAGAAGKYAPSAPLPSAQVVIDGVTNYFVANNYIWKTNMIAFIAKTNKTTIELDGNPLGLLFDSFKFEELANTNYGNFFLAEESLQVFKGENALGGWTLGIWDTRSGMAANANLLGWNLQVTFSSTNVNLVALTNRVDYTNTVGANSMAYFGIDVPTNASYSTNIITSLNPGDPLDLLFNQTGLPTGDLPGDVYLVNLQTSGTNVLNKGNLPILQPGRRYFLGVHNPNTVPQDYRLRVDFDVVTDLKVTPLTNGVVLATNIVATNIVQYYSFDVSTNAAMVSFELLNPTNDVDLVVRHALPVPTRLDFDYLSANPGTNSEFILVRTNSSPVPLSSGRWYIGVYGYTGTNAADYQIRATEWSSTLIVLTNQVPYTNTFTNGFRFFAVDVPAQADAVTNILVSLNPGDPLTFLYNLNGLPGVGLPTDYVLGTATNRNTNILSLAGTPALQPGQRYYLAAVNSNGVSEQFKIQVGFHISTNTLITPLTNAILYTNSIGATNALQYYSFDVSTNGARVAFEILKANGNVDLVARHAQPLPDRLNHEFLSANPGNSDESIVVLTNSSPVSLTPGRWYLGVYNVAGSGAITYSIRASEWETATNLVVLTNQVAFTNTAAPNTARYFAVDVPAGANMATNTLISLNPVSPLTLVYSQIGLPTGILPGDSTLLSATVNGISVLTTNGTVPVLQPGQRYYLEVSNTNATPVQFSIEVAFGFPVTPLTNTVSYQASLTSTNIIQYYSFNVSTNAAKVAFEILGPNGDVDMVVRHLPPLPDQQNHDYISANSGTSDESVIIETNSSPVALTPGLWFIGVYKPAGTAAVDYTIRAVEWLVPPVPPTVLTNGVLVIQQVDPGSILYFVVDVPTNVDYTTNTLISTTPGDPLSLLFSAGGPPTGTYPGDYTLLDMVTDGVSILATNVPAPFIKPGQRYYLGVSNTNTVSEEFVLQIEFGFSVPIVITPLTNAIPLTNTIAPGSLLHYYSFEVASNATLASFETLNADGNIDLVVRRGLPVPNQASYDIISANAGASDEAIVVLPGSTPVPLAPGPWYLAVYNNEAGPVTYSIRAMQLTGTNGPALITLTNAVSHPGVAGPGASFDANLNFVYYQFVITNSKPGVVFTVSGATGNVNLLARLGGFPNPQWLDGGSWNVDAEPELVLISTNAAIPSLNGTWFLAVPNDTPDNVNFNIAATLLETNLLSATVRDITPGTTTNAFSFAWDSILGIPYAVDISTNLPDFTEITNILAVSTNSIFIDPTPVDTNSVPYRFYRLRVVLP